MIFIVTHYSELHNLVSFHYHCNFLPSKFYIVQTTNLAFVGIKK